MKKVVWAWLCLCIGLISFGNVTLNTTSTYFSAVKVVAPQDSSDVPVYYFLIKSDAPSTNADTFLSITFSTAAGTVGFGSGITAVHLYLDLNNDGSLSDIEKQNYQKAYLGFSTPTNIAILSLTGEYVSTDTSRNYFLTIDLADSAQYGPNKINMNVTGLTIASGTTAIDSAAITSQNLSISALLLTDAASTLNYVFPGDSTKLVMSFSLLAKGETILNNPFTIELTNSGKNFDASYATDGIINASIWLDNGSIKQQIDTDDTLITSASITTTSMLSFINVNIDLAVNITSDFLLSVDIGGNSIVGITQSVKFSRVQSIGDASQSIIKVTAFSGLTKSLSIAGLRLESLSSIIPTANFSGNMMIPMQYLRLTSQFLSSSINVLVINNEGTLSFQQLNDTNVVTDVYIYQDTYANDYWDKYDTLVGYLQVNNTVNQVHPPTQISITLNNVLIPTYNSFVDERDFFIVYKLHFAAEPRKTAESKLYNLSYKDRQLFGVHEMTHYFSLLPTASFSTSLVDIAIHSVTELVPSYCYQGEQKVPLLKISLHDYTSYNDIKMSIKNTIGSFYGTDNGIKRVWLVNDVNADNIYTAADEIMAVTRSFQDATIAELTTIALVKNHDYNLLVLADVGMGYPVQNPNNNLWAQLLTISSNTTSIVSGIFPQPSLAAMTYVTTNKFSIISVTADTAIYATQNTPFEINVRISNKFAQSITITDIWPQFYKETLGGLNLSYQYRMTPLSFSTPFIVPPLATTDVKFSVIGIGTQTQTKLIAGAVIHFSSSTGNHHMIVDRYFNDPNWINAGTNQAINVTVVPSSAAYIEYPDYINSVDYGFGGVTASFRNREVIPKYAELNIHLKNFGLGIDYNRSSIYLNNTLLQRYVSDNWLQIDEINGIITIQRLQNLNGDIKLMLADQAGNFYDESHVYFLTNEAFSINDFLVYPSLARHEDIPITLQTIGFTLSQPGYVKLFLIDAKSRVIWSTEQNFVDMGYKTIIFNGRLDNGELINRGYYILRLVATNSLNQKIIKRTKFSLW